MIKSRAGNHNTLPACISNFANNPTALDITVKSRTMKYLFDIDGIAYEIELSKGETKQLEYKKGRFAKVSLYQISQQPTKTSIGSAFLHVEFDNGNVWKSKDAVIPRI